MLETFLILLAGGVMLAVVVSDPNQVTLNWLRLAGILALCFAGLANFWFWRSGGFVAPDLMSLIRLGMVLAIASIAMQLGLVQVAWRQMQRVCAGLATGSAIGAGIWLLHRGYPHGVTVELLACIGIAAVVGLAMMDMLIGHAYLTASKMTMMPFRRLNVAFAASLGFRTVCSLVVVAHFINQAHPVDRLWPRYGLLIGTRWLVGLALPAVFVYMAHDCIKRRATQSATGILFVALVLVLIGEIIALNLVRDTGLPF